MIVLFLALAGLTGCAVGPRHDLYLCVSQAKPFIIGGKVRDMNGVYRVYERTTPAHIGFNHPRVDSLAADPRDPRRIYTVGLNGVMRTTDAGRSWRIVTSWDMTEPKDIAVDPRAPDTVYIGLPDGIAVSRDGGETWKRSNAGITRAYTQSVVVDRTRAGRLLVGTELGVYLSEDGAATWRRVLATSKTVNDVRQSPHDPKVFLAATQADGAALSRDGGLTWKTLPGVGSAHTLHNGDFDATNPARLIVCGWDCGVLVSDDGGATWSERNKGLPNAQIWRVSADPDIPGRLYASPHQEPVFASDDVGHTWRPIWFSSTTVWDFVFTPRS